MELSSTRASYSGRKTLALRSTGFLNSDVALFMQWIGGSNTCFAETILCASSRGFSSTKHCASSSSLTAILLQLYRYPLTFGTTITLATKVEITRSPRD